MSISLATIPNKRTPIKGALAQYFIDGSKSTELNGKVQPYDFDGTNTNRLTGEELERVGRKGWCYEGDGSTTFVEYPNAIMTTNEGDTLKQIFYYKKTSNPISGYEYIVGTGVGGSGIAAIFQNTTGSLRVTNGGPRTGSSIVDTGISLDNNVWYKIELESTYVSAVVTVGEVDHDLTVTNLETGETENWLYSFTNKASIAGDFTVYIGLDDGTNYSWGRVYGYQCLVNDVLEFEVNCQEESGNISYEVNQGNNSTSANIIHTQDDEVTFSDANDRGAGIVAKDLNRAAIASGNIVTLASDFKLKYVFEVYPFFTNGNKYYLSIRGSGIIIYLTIANNTTSSVTLNNSGTNVSFTTDGISLYNRLLTLVIERNSTVVSVSLSNDIGESVSPPTQVFTPNMEMNEFSYIDLTGNLTDYANGSLKSLEVWDGAPFTDGEAEYAWLDFTNSNLDTGSAGLSYDLNPATKIVTDGVVPLLEDGVTPANSNITQAQYIGQYKPYLQLKNSPCFTSDTSGARIDTVEDLFVSGVSYLALGFWFRYNSTGVSKGVLRGGSSAAGGLGLKWISINASNKLVFEFWNGDKSTSTSYTCNDIDFSDNVARRIFILCDYTNIIIGSSGGSGFYYVYIDGVLKTTIAITQTVSYLSQEIKLVVYIVGGISSGGTDTCDGSFAGLELYKSNSTISDGDESKLQCVMSLIENTGSLINVIDVGGDRNGLNSYSIISPSINTWSLTQNVYSFLQAKGGKKFEGVTGRVILSASTPTIPASSTFFEADLVRFSSVSGVSFFTTDTSWLGITRSTAGVVTTGAFVFDLGGRLTYQYDGAGTFSNVGAGFTVLQQEQMQNQLITVRASISGNDLTITWYYPSDGVGSPILTYTVDITTTGNLITDNWGVGFISAYKNGGLRRFTVYDDNTFTGKTYEFLFDEASNSIVETEASLTFSSQDVATGYLPTALDASGNSTFEDVQGNALDPRLCDGRAIQEFDNEINVNPEDIPAITQMGYDDVITSKNIPDSNLGSLFGALKARSENGGYNNLTLFSRGVDNIAPCVTLNGIDQDIRSQDIANTQAQWSAWNDGKKITHEFWLNCDSSAPAATETIYGNIGLQVLSGGTFENVGNIGASFSDVVDLGTDLRDDEWHFIKHIHDVDNKTHSIYIDGVLESQRVYTSYSVTDDEVRNGVIYPLYYGSRTGTLQFFQGSIAGIKVYNEDNPSDVFLQLPLIEGAGSICNVVKRDSTNPVDDYELQASTIANWAITQTVYDYLGAYGGNTPLDVAYIDQDINTSTLLAANISGINSGNITATTANGIGGRNDVLQVTSNSGGDFRLEFGNLIDAQSIVLDQLNIKVSFDFYIDNDTATNPFTKVSALITQNTQISEVNTITEKQWTSISGSFADTVVNPTSNVYGFNVNRSLATDTTGAIIYIDNFKIELNQNLPSQLPLNGTDVQGNNLTTEEIERVLDQQRGLRFQRK